MFPSPLPLEETGSPPCDGTSSASVSSHIKEFLGCCELNLFANIIHLDYVGLDSVTSPETICQISSNSPSYISIIYQSCCQTRTCRVDNLIKKYLSKVPVLPNDMHFWGFTLTNYFWWSTVSKEMQLCIMENKLYNPLDMSTVAVTKTIQLNEL
jgi:hypothetical protein